MDKNQEERAELFLQKDKFRSNAARIVIEVATLLIDPHISDISENGFKEYLDEILHSIFFLGWMNVLKFTPDEIFGEAITEVLKSNFPEPLQNYMTRLPKRTPFSCLLDMVVIYCREVSTCEPEIILRELQKITKNLPGTDLVASTICMSQKRGGGERYYGASMSCSGRIPGQIMIAVSCLETWHDSVSNAVMTYRPEKKNKGFDGTMKLDERVECKAYNVKSGKAMPPCKSCGEMFGLKTEDKNRWPYGHCAEAESLSKLLCKEEDVTRLVKNQDANVQKQVLEEVEGFLKKKLKEKQFEWDNTFYSPQQSYDDCFVEVVLQVFKGS